jgi:hypothetical protein
VLWINWAVLGPKLECNIENHAFENTKWLIISHLAHILPGDRDLRSTAEMWANQRKSRKRGIIPGTTTTTIFLDSFLIW